MLAETGTVILKCMLHISKEEQRQRLQERLDDPAKHWKFQASDLATRQRWDAYQTAYEQAIAATASPWAPWHIVPADSKTHRNLMIARLLRSSCRPWTCATRRANRPCRICGWTEERPAGPATGSAS